MKKISNIILPIIYNNEIKKIYLHEEIKNKRVIIFGLPGAFTPTCSDNHLPGYLHLYKKLKQKYIDDVYCLSVNDHYVMQAWFLSKGIKNSIKGIADGNAELTKSLDLLTDKSKNYMGMRSNRFVTIVKNFEIQHLFIEKSGELKVSSAEEVLKII